MAIQLTELRRLRIAETEAVSIYRALVNLSQGDPTSPSEVCLPSLITITLRGGSTIFTLLATQAWRKVTNTILTPHQPFTLHTLLFKATYPDLGWPKLERVCHCPQQSVLYPMHASTASARPDHVAGPAPSVGPQWTRYGQN